MYAIKLENISKTYHIYKKPLNRIIDSIFNTKKYKEYHALKNISIEIPKGEAVGVLGKNGAGKSTLLKIVTGVVKPTSGEIYINGKIAAILELNSGFDDELTGYDNIYLKGTIMGYDKKEIDKKVKDIVDFADIGEHIHQPVRTYSSGMKSRLGFAISVNIDPDILIVDEALSVGDDVFKTKCLNKMSEFRRAGKTIFFVSHSLFTVKSFCNKCMWIKNGEVVAYGETGEIIPKYESFLKEEKAKDKQRIIEKSSGEILSKKDIIKVTNFKFSKGNNKFNYGEDIEYSFDYEVKKNMPGLKWSFTVRDAETREIYSTDKMGEDYLIKNEIGKHSLKVVIKSPKLLPGKYLLSGELREETGIMYVGYSNKRKFEVIVDKNYRGTGIFYMDHEIVSNI